MTQEELDALMKIGEELENEQNSAENLSEQTPPLAGGEKSRSDFGEGSAHEVRVNDETQSTNLAVNLENKTEQISAENSTQTPPPNPLPKKSSIGLISGAGAFDGENSADNATVNSSTNSAENLSTNSSTNSNPNPDTINIFAPPTNNEHKVVHQLDEVTRDSEIKAVEMMDRLENLGKLFSHSEISLQKIREDLEKMGEVFEILCTKFPHINTFKDLQERQKSSIKESDEIFSRLSKGQDGIFEAMDAMQYQDIHRQKIERAINVMRALNRYMNSLFEGSVDDSKRVASATYIAGDSQNAMSDDDIEDLIASLRAK